MPGYLEQLFEYNIWATERLLGVLAKLPSSVLDASASGGFGTVHETLVHILDSERYYVARLLEQRIPEDLKALDLMGLREVTASLSIDLRKVAQNLPDPQTEYQRRLGPVTAATVLTQLFQHGCEHRAQVVAALGAQGVALPSIDPWAHGRVLAGLPPLEPPATAPP